MKRVLLLALFISLILASPINARTKKNAKALFIYQFTKLIDWPAETKTGMFRIGVMGSFESYKQIMDVAMGRNVGRQNIEVMNLMGIDQLSLADFHILVVCKEFCTPDKLKDINTRLSGKNTLIIAHKANYPGNYVDIGFEVNGQKIKYYYAEELIRSKDLKCSRDFLQLGQKEE